MQSDTHAQANARDDTDVTPPLSPKCTPSSPSAQSDVNTHAHAHAHVQVATELEHRSPLFGDMDQQIPTYMHT